nr:inactive polyglycylase TTLL10 isoform X1 [Microcebus murinus]
MFKSVFRPSRRGVVSCRSLYLTSRRSGPARRGRRNSAQQRRNAGVASPSQGARPLTHQGDKSQPQAETQAHGPQRPLSSVVEGLGAHPTQGPGPRASQGSRKGTRVTSAQRGPRPGAPIPVARGRTRFIHHWGHPARIHVGSKTSKRSRIRRCRAQAPSERAQAPSERAQAPSERAQAPSERAQAPSERAQAPSEREAAPPPAGRNQRPIPKEGWAHERPMGSHREEGLPRQPSLLDRDADLLDTEDAARPPAALLEELLQEETKQPPGAMQGPFFYIGGTNGASIVSSYCKSKGWQRTQDSRREDYKLKWCEVKSRDSYCSFREGEQLLYQLPNNKLLTTKIGLLCALREYSRVVSKVNTQASRHRLHAARPHAPGQVYQSCVHPTSRFHPNATIHALTPHAPGPRGADLKRTQHPPLRSSPLWTSPGRLRPHRALKMEEFFPETYRLDSRDERDTFFTLFDETQMWICKPTASNQGKGIFLLRSQEEVAALQARTQSIEDDPIYRKMPFRAPQARVVQRYIQKPLLLEGKKFDVRSYLVIACATPYMVFFAHGYARLTLSLYDPHAIDLSGHLTNQKRMQQIMAHCFLAVKSKLEGKLGYFDLIGCDFLIDENFKVWLLEMNSNPALHTNCEVLKEVIPSVVVETLDLALETFQKSLHNQKMLPLLSQRRFVLLHNGEADVWPRLGGSRNFPGPLPPPRLPCEAGPARQSAADRPPPRAGRPPGPGGAQARTPLRQARRSRPPTPPGAARKPQAPGAERPRAGGRNPAREPSPGTGTTGEARKGTSHRGS